jgi:hypothetical protein
MRTAQLRSWIQLDGFIEGHDATLRERFQNASR